MKLLLLIFGIVLPNVAFAFNLNNYWCSSCDDPHFRTFDGKTYDFQKAGDFYVLYNDFEDTRVTASFRKCVKWSPKATCHCGAHIKYKDAYLFIDVCGVKPTIQLTRRTFYAVNNTAYEAFCGSKTVPGNKETDNTWWNTPGNAVNILTNRFLCARSASSQDIFIIRTNDPIMNKNIFVKLQVHDIGIACVKIRPSLSSYSSTGGLCGIFNENPNDDLTIYDPNTCGLINVDPNTFGTFWQLNTNPVSQFPFNTLEPSACPCDPLPRLPGASSQCVNSLPQCVTNNTLPAQDFVRDYNSTEIDVNEATQYCTQLFTSLGFTQAVAEGRISQADYNFWFNNCVFDYSITGDPYWPAVTAEVIRTDIIQKCTETPSSICQSPSITKPVKCSLSDYPAYFTDGYPFSPCPRTPCVPK